MMVISPSAAIGGVRVASWEGDALVALSALFYTLHILRLSVLAPRCNPWPLTTSKSTTQMLGSQMLLVSLCVGSGVPLRASVNGVPPVLLKTMLYTGIVTCAFPMWAQGYGQQSVRPSHATLIYATAPVWNAAIAALLLGERLAP